MTAREDGTEKKEININNKGMSTGSAEILSKHGTLKIPIKRHLLQKLKEDVELRANIQSHMVSPRLFTGDTSSIQSLLLQISDEPTAVQLKSFQRWYAEEIDGDVYSLCGFFAMLGVISLASTSEKLTEKMTAYENFMRCKQSNLSLSEYHHKYRAVVVELEIVLNTTLNADLTAHFFMLQMAPDLQERFKILYQTQHPGVGYEWRHMYPLLETLGRSSTKNHKRGVLLMRKRGKVCWPLQMWSTVLKSVREVRYVVLEATLGLEVDTVGALNVNVPSATERPARNITCGGSARLLTVGWHRLLKIRTKFVWTDLRVRSDTPAGKSLNGKTPYCFRAESQGKAILRA